MGQPRGKKLPLTRAGIEHRSLDSQQALLPMDRSDPLLLKNILSLILTNVLIHKPQVKISVRKPAWFHNVGKLTVIDRFFYQP